LRFSALFFRFFALYCASFLNNDNDNKHAYAGTKDCFTHLRVLLVLAVFLFISLRSASFPFNALHVASLRFFSLHFTALRSSLRLKVSTPRRPATWSNLVGHWMDRLSQARSSR
jgi:hypothetical protein